MSQRGHDVERLRTLTKQLDALFAPWNRMDAPGLTVGAAWNGAVIYRRGFGMASLEQNAANTPRTRMRIGSVTKHFTCLLALLLAEEGKLNLDAPIRTYVFELEGPGGEPTLRQLMQHRGGSRCYLDLGFIGHGMNAPPAGEALRAQIRQAAWNFPPGEAMIYNNGGYHLLSIAIERAGGAPFETQIRERLLAPLGMADTDAVPSDHDITPRIATLHEPLEDGRWRRGLFPSVELRGEGALVSTIDDMLIWMAHLRRRDRFGAAATWASLTERPIYSDGSSGVYALGLVLQTYRGLRTVQHSGGVIGGSSQMLTLPDEGLDIVVLSNGAPDADPSRLAEQMVDIILSDRLAKAHGAIAAGAHEAIVGDWWSSRTGMLYTLVDDAGVLKLQIGVPASMPLQPAADGTAICQPVSLGQIALDMSEVKARGQILISFGGQSAAYVKVSKADGNTPAFAAVAAGRYSCPDAGAEATIALDGEGLVIALSDGFGRVEADVVPLGETVAVTVPTSPANDYGWAISLDQEEGGAVTGFRLNTPRTRDLVFKRSQ